MKNLFIILTLFCPVLIFSQQTTTERAPTIAPNIQLANTITTEELHRHISILASDEFEGRETGTEGQRKAAKYIAEAFKSFGLPAHDKGKTYFQKISFSAQNWEAIDLDVSGERIKHLSNFYSLPANNSDLELNASEIVFLGYGIDDPKYSDYANKKVKDKSALIYAGEPVDKNGNRLIGGSPEPSDWVTDTHKKLKAAKAHGVKTLFIVDHNFEESLKKVRRQIVSRRMTMSQNIDPKTTFSNSLVITPELAKKICGPKFAKTKKAIKKINAKGKAKSFSLPCDVNLVQTKKINSLVGENVIGFIEGTDEKLKDEIVIITAHYDHLGKRKEKVYNGADDNASGTASVIEIAEAFAEAQKRGIGPRRSVVCMLVSGEEKGLLGSKYYTEYPTFPLENTIANLNIDMIGRVDEKHEGNPDYIYLIGSDRLSTTLHQISETANATYTQLELDYTYNADSDPNRYYYRSDHYNFAKNGIPVIFYFNGTHADYHRASDTTDKIDFEKVAKISRLVFHTAWELSMREDRIEVDGE